MKPDPEEFWDNVPHEIEPVEDDVTQAVGHPIVHDTNERVREEEDARKYTD